VIVALVSATYRTYAFEYVRGLVSVLAPTRELEAELSQYEFVPVLARGYGGGRQTALGMRAALAAGAEVAVTVECDIAWDAGELLKLLRSYRASADCFGAPAAIGAVYPASSRPDQLVFAPAVVAGMSTDEVVAAAVRRLAGVEKGPRYVEAEVLPCGFTAWPLADVAQVDPVEHVGADIMETYDRGLSEALRRRGVRLFYDLDLDVGHHVDVPTSARTVSERVLHKISRRGETT